MMHRSKRYLIFFVAVLLISQVIYAKLADPLPLAGEGGLREAEVNGLIRKAKKEDVRQYLLAEAKVAGLPDHLIPDDLGSRWYPLEQTYIILSPDFTIPYGLADIHLSNVSFIVPEGLPEPKGARGLVRIYRYGESKPEKPIAAACTFPGLPAQLPANAKIFAYGADDFNSDVKVNVQIDPSTAISYLRKITVNSPLAPVILFLQASDAGIWHFNWTKGTKISAVYINGKYKQVVSGLPKSVPVFISDQADSSNTCPPVKVSPHLQDLIGFNNLSRHLFKKDIDELRQIKEGETVAGLPLSKNSVLETGETLNPDKFRMPPNPLIGTVGIREALSKGLIRKANEEDVRQYKHARARAEGLSEDVIKNNLGDDPFYLKNFSGSYVVLSVDFVIPDGLYDGLKPASYIVPKGMPEPRGPRRGVEVYSYDQLKSLSKNKKPIAKTCKFINLATKLPPNGLVYALSDGLGAELDFQIEGGAKAARLMEIKANSPSEPVFLFLTAHHSTIWHFSWTKDTKIAAVFISSNHKQIVSGLPKNTPVLISNKEDSPNPCPEVKTFSFFSHLVEANDLSRHLFNKSIGKIYSPQREKETRAEANVVVGRPLNKESKPQSAEVLDVKKFRDPNTLLTGLAGLNEAIDKGLIQEASDGDIKAYKIAEAKSKGIPNNIITSNLELRGDFISKYYVVLSRDFVIPEPPSSTLGIALIVPEGLPEPRGSIAHRYHIYSYERLKPLSQARKETTPIGETCKFAKLSENLPANAKVYAIGPKLTATLGARLDFYIDDKNTNPPLLMKITVNSPSEPVLLMLDTTDSTIWQFNWTPGTKIAAVYIEGFGRQVASGLPPDVPVLVNKPSSNKNEPSLCPWFSVSSDTSSLTSANALSRHLFNRDIHQLHELETTKEFVIGKPLGPLNQLKSAEELKPEKYKEQSRPMVGEKGLEESLAKGLIRRAELRDIKKYLEARAKAEGLPDHIIKNGFNTNGYAIYHNPYVVLSPNFVIPEHLYAEESASFIVPEGQIPPKKSAMSRAKAPFLMPKRRSGHHGIIEAVASRIYSYEDLKTLPADLYDHEEQVSLGNNRHSTINCFFPNLAVDFPGEAKVYALGADYGRELDFQIESDSAAARLMRVTVNSPSKPTLLLMKADSPTIWHFNWTQGSKIAGVFISGNGPQRVSGLPPEVPILIANAQQCPKFEVSSSLINLISVNNLSKQLFKKDIEQIFNADRGEIVIGQPLAEKSHLETAAEFDINKFRDPATPLPGLDGLNEAITKGLIRKANIEDIQKYSAAKSKAKIKAHSEDEDLPEHLVAKMGYGRIKDLGMRNTYTVLSPDFIIPAKLVGADAANFIVPEGLPEPKGPRGNCRIFSEDKLLMESRDSIKKHNESPNFNRHISASHWKPKFNSSCSLPKTTTPDKIYAIGASSRHMLDFQIDGSGEQARLMKLVVNEPSKSVALFLKSRNPTIWHLSWTKGTKISAVITSGGGKQVVSGVPQGIPVLSGKGDGYDLSLCPPKFGVAYDSRDIKLTNGLSRHFFNKDLDDIETLKDGIDEYVVGQPLKIDNLIESAEKLNVTKFFDPGRPLAGDAGLREALSKGQVRKATKEDILHYLKARNKAGGLTEKAALEAKLRDLEATQGRNGMNCSRNFSWGADVITGTRIFEHSERAYVVLSPDFAIPSGVTFPLLFVPKGLPKPKGPLGCGEIFSYDDLLPIQ